MDDGEDDDDDVAVMVRVIMMLMMMVSGKTVYDAKTGLNQEYLEIMDFS